MPLGEKGRIEHVRPRWYTATRHQTLLARMDAVTRRRMGAEQRRHEAAMDRLGSSDPAASLDEFQGYMDAVEAIVFQVQQAGR